MEINEMEMRVLYKQVEHLSDLKKLKALQPFDEDICQFLNAVSERLLKDKRSRQFPDVMTFAFFIRKANLSQLKEQYACEQRLGRGLSFHIAPSNVPVNFAYSMVAGCLAGNSCIVRASSKDFAQTRLICEHMQQVAEQTKNPAAKYMAVVLYDKATEATKRISAISDVRVIWGGDATVEQVKQYALPVRAIDIAFADRYSMCVMNAKAVLQEEDIAGLAQHFYNDTYLYDQNACSSPRLIYWIGSDAEVEQAKQKFWHAVRENIQNKYRLEAVVAVDKLTMAYRAAIELEDVVLEPGKDNRIQRIKVSSLDKNLMHYAVYGGSFIEYSSTDLNELAKMDDKKVQTLAFYGMEKEQLCAWVIQNGLSGIDRIVPIGKTADFGLIWDGYNLIGEMSRRIG